MTNYELIKQKIMESQTADEVKKVIDDYYLYPTGIYCVNTKCGFYKNCNDCHIEWLNKEVDNGNSRTS